MNIRITLVFSTLPFLLVGTSARAEERPGPFDARLLEVAKEYPRYGRVDDEGRWAPELCRLPRPSTARFSQSDDPATHGEKLYFLFAKDRAGYVKLTEKPAADADDPVKKDKLQVVVKEAWKAKQVPATEKPQPVYEALKKVPRPKLPGDDPPEDGIRGTYLPYAKKGDKLYKAHDKAGLYIMLQVDPKTEGTDEGWVYGTLTPDGKTVTSAGRVESCMKCHQDAPHGRLFGLAPK